MAINRKSYTAEDFDALRKKLENPDVFVVCPRCNNEIVYEQRGNSVSVECKTAGCIFGGVRGL